ncbi:MAG: DUF362 domain-containing protein [Verrucomicrobiae bacterium]
MKGFLLLTAGKVGACFFALFATAGFCRAAVAEVPPAKIYYVADTAALTPAREVNPGVVRRMVDRLIMAATGQPDVARAWGSLVKTTDRVGIKVSAAGGAVSGTNPQVVDAIVDGLKAAGLPASRIIVWDRNIEDLIAAGYRRDGSRYSLRWVDRATGYDPQAQVNAPVLGKLIWGDFGFGDRSGSRFSDMSGEQLSNKSFYSKILSREVTKIINVPSLTDSFLTGINGALANMVLPNIDNWRRFTKPPSYGDPYLAEIYADAMIKEKIAITILDGLVLQYAGGPFANPGFLQDHFTIYASRDPVAVDATAARLVDDARKPSKLPALAPMTSWLQAASSIGLGQHAAEKIELIQVGAEGPR